MKIVVDATSINKFVNSMCELMENEPRRIQNNGEVEFIDTVTNVMIQIGHQNKWVIKIPGSHSFNLDEKHKEQITDAVSRRENALLLEIHDDLYQGQNNYKLFTEIQKLRDSKQMIEDAYQNLLTVYALNMDGDSDVS